MRACLRAAHSSIRSFGMPSATALAMPPISSMSLMNCTKENTGRIWVLVKELGHIKNKLLIKTLLRLLLKDVQAVCPHGKPSELYYRHHLWEPPSCGSPPRDRRLWGCPTLPGWWSGCSWQCERSSPWASPEPHRTSWCGVTGSPRTQLPWPQSLYGSHCCMDPTKRVHRGKDFNLTLRILNLDDLSLCI